MSRPTGSMRRWSMALVAAGALSQAGIVAAHAQTQKVDAEYTARIKKNLSDPRISTELVDHLPASATVPTPLKFLGHIVGDSGILDHAADIHRYLQAVAKAAPKRAKFWTIGKSEEGRDIVVMAIADEATLAKLDTYKGYLNQLTDPRKTTEAQAKQLIKTAKPIYYITSGMHSPESGGPEMLMELAYRLVVEETPFIQNIRNNVITFITPVVEVDGREKYVDNHYFNEKWNKDHPSTGGAGAGGRGGGPLSLMYWGKYVQHDNNRDGMGQYLELTKAVTRVQNQWTPTIMHDLHEAQTYLYSSTGTGPYNDALDPIVVDEWWYLAKNDVMEMTKRGVPGVWTYGFYDGWVPNYMFFIAHTHNAIGRFYEVQSYCSGACQWYPVTPPATTTSKEWFRPNPPLDSIMWSPRANTNIQESAILFSLSRTAKDKEMFLENYWLKNKRAIAKSNTGVAAWVIPAGQHARENAAEAVNELKTQGLEFHVAGTSFDAGKVHVNAGDYIIRGDQPYRTIADMYFALQNFSPANPSPYDDTGWTFPLMRNITVNEVTDKSILKQPMTMVPMTKDVTAPGGVTGSGSTIVVENNSDNTLVSLRFKFPNVKMAATEDAFDAEGTHYGAGAFVIANANRAQIEPALKQLGLSGHAMASAPAVKTHDLEVPRIGYIHSWTRTQDEGWVRAALDTYGVPYKYFGENALASMGDLRSKFDVLIYPHGGSGVGNVGGGRGGAVNVPVPYKSTKEFPSLGFPDSTDDVRGALGEDGMKALFAFVQHGGTVITEGSTSQILPELNLTPGVKVEPANGLFARGTILRGVISDAKSPLVYGYTQRDVPVYFSAGPVLNAGAGAVAVVDNPALGGRGGRAGINGQNTTPMATPLKLSSWDPDHTGTTYGLATSIGNDFNVAQAGGAAGRGGRGGGGGGGFGGGGGGGAAAPVAGLSADPSSSTRVVMQFPAKPEDMLLSGTLENGNLLASRALLVDEKIGNGHLVMFAFRPYWRWQTQGTFATGFNAIVNWNHLDAGK
ncbi:MAG: peptidase carboxypeptidase [Gemmatimonadetes bacterium]|nr:peptidase carboxypeptidase [Gemmatimonadota bacterium]